MGLDVPHCSACPISEKGTNRQMSHHCEDHLSQGHKSSSSEFLMLSYVNVEYYLVETPIHNYLRLYKIMLMEWQVSWMWFCRSIGLDDLQRPFPTSIFLWFFRILCSNSSRRKNNTEIANILLLTFFFGCEIVAFYLNDFLFVWVCRYFLSSHLPK